MIAFFLYCIAFIKTIDALSSESKSKPQVSYSQIGFSMVLNSLDFCREYALYRFTHYMNLRSIFHNKHLKNDDIKSK